MLEELPPPCNDEGIANEGQGDHEREEEPASGDEILLVDPVLLTLELLFDALAQDIIVFVCIIVFVALWANSHAFEAVQAGIMLNVTRAVLALGRVNSIRDFPVVRALRVPARLSLVLRVRVTEMAGDVEIALFIVIAYSLTPGRCSQTASHQ